MGSEDDGGELAALRVADGEQIADDVERADSGFARFLGLMFRRRFPEGAALLFDMGRTRWDLFHMVFVPFPVALLVLDADRRVTRRRRLSPWIGVALVRGRYVVELPAGAAEDVEEGDVIEFVSR